ncbi:ABC transporter ATP-binding protein [Clostridioides sp. ES-S-0005-03]|nr:ABC transporter ATP-binding protein [Clostridioides sp. ES-S-0005-03]UDN46976.1 ABC transporter ATP-binding protein [Clostridioides sp. ES-S-0173-01]
MNRDISIKDLKIHFNTKEGKVRAVDGISRTFQSGKITGIIGETGSGKSVLGLGILNLVSNNSTVSGSVLYEEKDLLKIKENEIREIRGKKIALIPQNPSSSFNPILKIGSHMNELFYYHGKEKKNSCKSKSLEILKNFFFSNSELVYNSYGFQLSGGMSQRALAAIGTALKPNWVIADEPTKGLDAIIRKQVYEVFYDLRSNMGVSMILITHDLMLAKKLCDEVVVMYAGKIIEEGTKNSIFNNPLHPYTRGLIDSQPNKKLIPIEGIAPSLTNLPKGCRFSPRCKVAKKTCIDYEPRLFDVNGSKVRCFLYDKSL